MEKQAVLDDLQTEGFIVNYAWCIKNVTMLYFPARDWVLIICPSEKRFCDIFTATEDAMAWTGEEIAIFLPEEVYPILNTAGIATARLAVVESEAITQGKIVTQYLTQCPHCQKIRPAETWQTYRTKIVVDIFSNPFIQRTEETCDHCAACAPPLLQAM